MVGRLRDPRDWYPDWGRLVIGDDQATLTAFGDFPSMRSSGPIMGWDDTIPLVHGYAGGTTLTVLNPRALGPRMFNLPNTWTSHRRWLCGAAVEGHLRPEPGAVFSAVKFNLTHLSGWLDAPDHKDERASGETGESGWRRWWPVDSIDETMTSDEMLIEFAQEWSADAGLDSEVVSNPTVVTVTPASPAPWPDLLTAAATPLEALLWVATGRHSALEHVSVRADDDGHKRYRQLWTSWLGPRRFERPTRRITPNEMLFMAAEMPKGFQGGVRAWYDDWHITKAALNPVIARHRAPFTYVDDHFFSVVASLEAISRRIHGERTTTLHRCFCALLDEAGAVGKAISGDDREEFIRGIVKSRNQRAHSTAPHSASIAASDALLWTARSLTWLLRYHVMLQIGFDAEIAQERVLNSREFMFEAGRRREAPGES